LFASPIRTRHPWYVIALALALSAFSAGYTERHFAIKTDVNELISPDLPWVQRVKAFLRAFPQREILVVVDTPTPELVERPPPPATSVLRSLLGGKRTYCGHRVSVEIAE
jgi:uncharacterized protein